MERFLTVVAAALCRSPGFYAGNPVDFTRHLVNYFLPKKLLPTESALSPVPINGMVGLDGSGTPQGRNHTRRPFGCNCFP